jgi:hypothetical protein
MSGDLQAAPDADEVEVVARALQRGHSTGACGTWMGMAETALAALAPLRQAERERAEASAIEAVVTLTEQRLSSLLAPAPAGDAPMSLLDDDGVPLGVSGLRQLAAWEGDDLRTKCVREIAIHALAHIDALTAKLEREGEWRRQAIRTARAVAIEDAARHAESRIERNGLVLYRYADGTTIARAIRSLAPAPAAEGDRPKPANARHYVASATTAKLQHTMPLHTSSAERFTGPERRECGEV